MIKKLSRCMVLILLLVSFALPVQAAENNVLTIKLYTDPGIKWEKGDYLTIIGKNNNTGEAIDMKLDLTKITEAGLEKKISTGNYQITDISYEGGNSKVEEVGYAITSNFVVAENEDSYNEIRIAVGYDEVEKLTMMYSEVMIKQNGALVNELTETSDTELPDSEIDDSDESKQTIEENQQEDEQQIEKHSQKEETISEERKEENQILKIVPLFFLTGVIAVILFVVHKKGII